MNLDMASLKRLSLGRLIVDSGRLFQCARLEQRSLSRKIEAGAAELCFGNCIVMRARDRYSECLSDIN